SPSTRRARVVFALAMFADMTSIRKRLAVRPVALMSSPWKSPILSPSFRDDMPELTKFMVERLRERLVPKTVLCQQRHFSVDVDVVAVIVHLRSRLHRHFRSYSALTRAADGDVSR